MLFEVKRRCQFGRADLPGVAPSLVVRRFDDPSGGRRAPLLLLLGVLSACANPVTHAERLASAAQLDGDGSRRTCDGMKSAVDPTTGRSLNLLRRAVSIIDNNTFTKNGPCDNYFERLSPSPPYRFFDDVWSDAGIWINTGARSAERTHDDTTVLSVVAHAFCSGQPFDFLFCILRVASRPSLQRRNR